LQELTTWLKLQPCINNAAVFCNSCIETESQESKISISFDENGLTKNFILEVSKIHPLTALGFYEPIDIPFIEYSLHRTDCMWYWNKLPFYRLDIINSNEELEKYIIVYNGSFPGIDFSKYSLLLGEIYTTNGVLDITTRLQKHSTNFILNLEITYNVENLNQLCLIALIVDKLSDESKVELNIVTSYDEKKEQNFTEMEMGVYVEIAYPGEYPQINFINKNRLILMNGSGYNEEFEYKISGYRIEWFNSRQRINLYFCIINNHRFVIQFFNMHNGEIPPPNYVFEKK
jgi:hypothetical protein